MDLGVNKKILKKIETFASTNIFGYILAVNCKRLLNGEMTKGELLQKNIYLDKI